MNYQNPYDAFAGVFIPHLVLSSQRVSLGAKILYAILASGVDIRGESLVNPVLLAAKMGVEEGAVLQLVDELSNAWLIKVRQDPAGTEFLSCHFPPSAWQKDKQARNERKDEAASKTAPRLLKLPAATAERSTRIGDSSLAANELKPEKQDADCVQSMQSKRDTVSRFSKKVCIEYAKARQQAEGKIANPYALGTAMSKTTEYDEEIALWLQSKGFNQSVA